MTHPAATLIVHPGLEDLLPDPAGRSRFDATSAALEAAVLVRRMRALAPSAEGGRGITQSELARRAGLTPPRISQIESGEGSNGPTYAVIRKIAQACGIDWTRLVRQGLAGLAAEMPAPVWPAAPAQALAAHEPPASWDASRTSPPTAKGG
ncbi:MAG: helix-turn-helix transcriptional regulator [Proteobacteria bacterium]|nr:helix-turn-helix transcriptional regulator [Pseudomonadota bacterium]